MKSNIAIGAVEMMDQSFLYLILFAIATLTGLVARRFNLPYTVSLVLVGIGIGSFNLLEAPHLTKDLLFSIFLPGLIFEAAFHLKLKNYWQNKLSLHWLAFPGVLITIFVVAYLLAPLIPIFTEIKKFSLGEGLILGAIVSATDPIAVVGLFKSLKVPFRLSVLVEGESLLNDGTASVFFALILSFVLSSQFSLLEGVKTFFYVVIVSSLVGAILGASISFIIKRIQDPLIGMTLTGIAAYGSFILAERIRSSGILSTLVCGMIAGTFALDKNRDSKKSFAIESFWEYIAFALNSIVFLLMGFEVRLSVLLALWKAILIGYLIMTFSRAIVVSSVMLLLHRTRERIPLRWGVILTWGGLRGSLSMVLALAIPAEYQPREYLIHLTFGIVILSILVQGLSMAPLLRFLGLSADKIVGEPVEIPIKQKFIQPTERS
jgi:CPA1 family monovalent cation:H+ antiporter